MALAFNSAADHLKLSSPSASPASIGSFAIRINTTWTDTIDTSTNRQFVWFVAADTTGPNRLQFQRFSNGKIYIGWVIDGVGDFRIAVDATAGGFFTSGVWHNHVFTWNDTSNNSFYYVDGTQKGTKTTLGTTAVDNQHVIGNGNSASTLR